jgi:hypothetical protein
MLRDSTSEASSSTGERSSRAPARRPADVRRARRRFLHFFPNGFRDETYVAWERDYKWRAHERWRESLGPAQFRAFLRRGEVEEVARRAVAIEGRTNLLFSFEKMALRDGVKTLAGARTFARGLHDLLHGRGSEQSRFERWVEALERLPRRQTRVLTWPVVTVFPFLAEPRRHVFLKPNVTRRAAREYGFDFTYRSRPNWETYQSLLAFAAQVRRDQAGLRPRDMIDLQSFVWVLGSDEYD